MPEGGIEIRTTVQADSTAAGKTRLDVSIVNAPFSGGVPRTMNTGESNCSLSRQFVQMLSRVVPALFLGLVIIAAGVPAIAQIDPPPGACNPESTDSCRQDDNLCTTERCNPTTLQCESVPVVCTADDNLCTREACNPNNGQCGSTPKSCSADDNLCTTEACNPNDGQCGSTPKSCTADDNLCTTEACNPNDGQCGSAPKSCTADDNLCTTEACNPNDGQCGSTPKACGSDDNPCTNDTCDPATGQCGGEAVTCYQDDNLCTTEACDPEAGGCASTPVTCNPDDNLCTTEVCVESTGECEPGAPRSCEQDSDRCTTEVCSPSSGDCVSEPTNPLPGECGAAVCRTPGFWGTHAGIEKANSKNITQAVITAAGGSLSVCGETITNTGKSDDESAVEAICVSPSGTIRLQLARQLTAAALNCVVSNGDGTCAGTPLYSTLFAACNAVCANAASSTSSVTTCISGIDCLNNGGKLLANGYCQTGTCADGVTPCKRGAACVDASVCRGLDGNCHSLPLEGDSGLTFEPTGPAGSPTACNAANKSACTVIGSGQTKCLY